MKMHAIIPIFIPHMGCPNDCVFCNQKTITAKLKAPCKDDVIEIIERNLKTIKENNIKTVEIAFFGGSFTGIPIEDQILYLSIAKEYKTKGYISKIHLSTRPDYINHEILKTLKEFSVDIIELGVQSFDDEVLKLSNRGHNKECVYLAAKLVKDYGFELGLQLMIGLPGDTMEKSINSAKEAVKIGPKIARLYPTVIIKDTELNNMFKSGNYTPPTLEENITTTKEMYKLLKSAGINVIRIGLKSTDHISENGDIDGGSYHPAFRQLVESEIAKEILEAQLKMLLRENLEQLEQLKKLGQPDKSLKKPEFSNAENLNKKLEVLFLSNGSSFSNMVGNRKSNRIYFEKKYPHVRFSFHVDSNLDNDIYLAKLDK